MKKITLLIAWVFLATVAFSAPGPASAAKDAPKDAATDADNTRRNKELSKEETADQQSENKADRDITQKIRKAVVKNKTLSMDAHNVKIITRDGKVTLKGPVKSAQEKKAVEKIAVKVAGKANVSNELEIAPPK